MGVAIYPTVTASAIVNALTFTGTDIWVSNNGSDSNDGSSLAKAVKTWRQLRRMLGNVAEVRSSLTIHVDATPPTDAVFLKAIIGDGAGLLIQGTRTQVAAGTFTAVTAQNAATQTPWSVTDAALVGGFAAHVGRIIRITAGARAGNYARIVKDLGGGAARVTPFGHFVPVILAGFFPTVTPQVGDAYEIVTLPSLAVGSLDFTPGSSSGVVNAAVPRNAVTFDSLALDGAFYQGYLTGTAIPIFMQQCVTTGLMYEHDFLHVAGGGLDAPLFYRASQANLLSTGSRPFGGDQVFHVQLGSLVQVDGDCLLQGAGFGLDGGSLTVLSCAVFDNTTADNACVVSYPGAECRVLTRLWGTNNAGHGVRVTSGHVLHYTNQPTVNAGLGAGREALIGGTDKLWAAVPYIEPTNNAQIVVAA